MPGEPIENIGLVCDEHAPKPQERFTKMEPKSFIGSHVKVAVPTGLKHPAVEHMWFKITGVTWVHKHLIGLLDNIAIFAPVMLGDGATIELTEIEDHLPEESPKVG